MHRIGIQLGILLASAALPLAHAGEGVSLVTNVFIAKALVSNPGVESARLEWEAMIEMSEVVALLSDPMISYGYYLTSVQARTGAIRQRFAASQNIPLPLGNVVSLSDLSGDQQNLPGKLEPAPTHEQNRLDDLNPCGCQHSSEHDINHKKDGHRHDEFGFGDQQFFKSGIVGDGLPWHRSSLLFSRAFVRGLLTLPAKRRDISLRGGLGGQIFGDWVGYCEVSY